MAIQQTTQIPEIQETIVKLRRLSADEQIRQEIYLRERILHDEATQMGNARREGIAEGRAEMKDEFIDALRQQGFTEDMINGVLERME